MTAILILCPKSKRLNGNSWQFPRPSLQLEISTTSGMYAANKPQAMGEGA
jgi:hypothetical protein